ncbi:MULTISPECIES: hypothetical protein [Actinosynnema]|uniref:hypothetical protein n=1 Tax=Actinosynnema TaxID=40566 RepID=UPI0020A2F731|nr:hypothetical protein [Actinosynnema pretiosum]MCP2097327.1 hypothetical protein [Actinosynnema pretiosum]
MTWPPDVFIIALVKGAVEGDPTMHFGSLLGVGQHMAVARELGLLQQDGQTPTDKARQLYERHELNKLPHGRAYLAWADSPLLDAALADLTNHLNHHPNTGAPRENT